MSGFVEIVMLLAALLADLLLGNYGCTPFLTVFVVFHASECVSVRFAAALALAAGVGADLLYCRSAAVMPLLMTAALFSGRIALGVVRSEGRGVFGLLFPGAVMGFVMSFGEILVRSFEFSWFDALCTVVSGAFFGALECVVMLSLLDAVAGALGLPRFTPLPGSGSSRELPRRRTHRVRAASMIRRRR